MVENKEKVELREKDLDKVTGGVNEFLEAEDLQLAGPEKKN